DLAREDGGAVERDRSLPGAGDLHQPGEEALAARRGEPRLRALDVQPEDRAPDRLGDPGDLVIGERTTRGLLRAQGRARSMAAPRRSIRSKAPPPPAALSAPPRKR